MAGGDSDGVANGFITDPGAPAYRQPSSVIVEVVDGALSITGTDQDDLLHVYQINSQTFIVEGIGGTTINGSNDRAIFRFAQALSVDLGLGNDNITFEGYFGKRRLGASLLLNTGEGDDEVTFDSFIGTDQVLVATEGGQDRLNILSSSFYGSSVFDLGDDDDELFLHRSGFHGNATINGGLDTDTLDALMLTESGIQDLLVEGFETGNINPQPLMLRRKPANVHWHKKHHAFVA